MRVVIVGPAAPLRGGIAAHGRVLAAALRDRGHEVRRLGFRRLYPPGLFPGKTESDPQHDHEPGGGRHDAAVLDALDPRTWKAGRRMLDAAHCDLVIVQWWHPFFAGVVRSLTRGAGVPIVAVCHNTRPHEAFPGWRIATRSALAGVDGFIAHSEHIAAEVESLFPGRPVTRTDMPALIAADGIPERLDARRRLGIRENARLALFAGHVRAYKGPEDLLAAWDRAQLPPMAGLVLAGESYLGDGKLVARVAGCRRSSTVRALDAYLSDVDLAAWMAAADVVVFPYRRASQSGLLPLAAALCGRTIASRVGGLAEQGEALGSRMVEPGDVIGLADALSEELARHDPPADAPRRRLWERIFRRSAVPADDTNAENRAEYAAAALARACEAVEKA